jgi:hypothetical protein
MFLVKGAERRGQWITGAQKEFNAPLATDLLRRHKSSTSFFIVIYD